MTPATSVTSHVSKMAARRPQHKFSARKVVELVLLLRKKDHPSDETSTKKCGELVSVILDRFGMEAILWSSSICVTRSDEEFFVFVFVFVFYSLGYLFGLPVKQACDEDQV